MQIVTGHSYLTGNRPQLTGPGLAYHTVDYANDEGGYNFTTTEWTRKEIAPAGEMDTFFEDLAIVKANKDASIKVQDNTVFDLRTLKRSSYRLMTLTSRQAAVFLMTWYFEHLAVDDYVDASLPGAAFRDMPFLAGYRFLLDSWQEYCDEEYDKIKDAIFDPETGEILESGLATGAHTVVRGSQVITPPLSLRRERKKLVSEEGGFTEGFDVAR